MKLINILPTRTEIRACWELCRLHNGVGCWFIWLPTAWALAMAYRVQPNISGMVALSRAAAYVPLCAGVKSLIMTIDDILDHDIDALVERTKNRPLPRGAISLQRAWIFFSLQCVIGVASAVYFLNPTSLWLSMISWPIFIVYPTFKRWMYVAPIPMSVMFNIGVFMGWADLSHQGMDWRTVTPMFLAACLFTIIYETFYQHQDRPEDITIGMKSMAILLGERTVPIMAVTALAFLALLVEGGRQIGGGALYYIGVAVAGAMFLRRIFTTDIDRPSDCKELFLEAPLIGRVILAGLVADGVVNRFTTGLPL